MLYPFNGVYPKTKESNFLAPGSHIIGNVEIGEDSSIWFNTVLRGDEGYIKIGERCNIQDNCTVHQYTGFPVILEDDVSIGHNVILHGCKIGRGSLIGMGSIIMDGVEIGEQVFVAAGTMITPGIKIPSRSVVMGSPGKVVREATDRDLEMITQAAIIYNERRKNYLELDDDTKAN